MLGIRRQFCSLRLHHATELHSMLIPKVGNKIILFVYTDGGPDHGLTFFTVQLTLIALFLNLNLDLNSCDWINCS